MSLEATTSYLWLQRGSWGSGYIGVINKSISQKIVKIITFYQLFLFTGQLQIIYLSFINVDSSLRGKRSTSSYFCSPY